MFTEEAMFSSVVFLQLKDNSLKSGICRGGHFCNYLETEWANMKHIMYNYNVHLTIDILIMMSNIAAPNIIAHDNFFLGALCGMHRKLFS